MGKKTRKRIPKSKKYSRRHGGKKDTLKEHTDVGLATFDVFLGGNEKDDVKDLDVAMSEFDLFDKNDSTAEDFGDMSIISRESDANNLNDTLNVFEDDDDEIVPENSIPFDEDDWMNLDEGFVEEDGDANDSYLNETTNESISFGGSKKKRRMNKRKTIRKRKATRKIKKRKYNRKTRNIKRIKIGGNVDRLGSPDFNPNLAFDKKQIGGQNIGGNCSDPNFSIYNTPMLKLFPYRA